MAQGAGRIRDADRTRKAILDAAEAVFADRGFDAAAIHEIATRAGVSRGTPAYFFGSKAALYAAVIARAGAARDAALERAFAPARALAGEGDVDPRAREAALEAAVEGYTRFLAEHPAFVRLMRWEALRDGRRDGAPREGAPAAEEGMRALTAGRDPAAAHQDPEQLAISFLALCSFPFEPGAARPAAPDPARARTRHVVQLLVRALSG